MAADRDDATGGTTEGTGDARTVPWDDDEEKTVVDPDPPITERIVSALDRDRGGEEAFPVTPEFVEAIQDRVVLRVERDEEFQERQG